MSIIYLSRFTLVNRHCYSMPELDQELMSLKLKYELIAIRNRLEDIKTDSEEFSYLQEVVNLCLERADELTPEILENIKEEVSKYVDVVDLLAEREALLKEIKSLEEKLEDLRREYEEVKLIYEFGKNQGALEFYKNFCQPGLCHIAHSIYGRKILSNSFYLLQEK